MLQEHNESEKRDTKTMIMQAYYTAAFQRLKKMPKLQELLGKIDKRQSKKAMTDNEMLKAVEKITAAFGGGAQ